ncbi:TNT domain-containing protein [Actinokineospora globicatena]|uniref:TNT domain-containing protein n=1 Tax=Actinokineospora globicatena TaxID=103729 RepID=UPI0020A50565|nr:TNT domain-containing protein [Actinokineospora globicatena]MCP2306297.1 Protein of unknown function (DUF4237) [Actinokineospora globicatena]GLW81722.1 hypothetical protein Aglo01_62030 [Actinokineospora globicatena]GLW88517.1 hypothetical protein Aglo02_61560 [Actinokineospora globicatena]
MSDADGTMSEAEKTARYGELIQRIGIALLEAAPPGWRRLDLVAAVTSSVQEYGLVVHLADGSAAAQEPPAEVADAFLGLREVTYIPETGAWFTARFVMNPPTEYHVFFNYQQEPRWEPPVPTEVYARDLERFPREADQVPNWLRRRLGMPPLPVSAEPAGLDEQKVLGQRISDLLVMRAPSDWTQLRVGYRAAGAYVELRGKVVGLDGQLRDWAPPAEVADEFAVLRARMAHPERGPWSGAQVIVEYPLRASTSYAYDDPGWQNPPPRPAVLDELTRFPRKPDAVPGWMRGIVPDLEQVLAARSRVRSARVFDRREPDGRPVVDRPPVPADQVPGVLRYLTGAHVLLGGRGHDPDLFVPDSAPDVPAGFHTDGSWIWPASIPHYLAKHGVPPEPDLVEHIRAAGFTPPAVDGQAAALAYTALTGEVVSAPAAAVDDDSAELARIALALSEAGVSPRAYSLDGPVDESWSLERVDGQWQVAQYERGRAFAARQFPTLTEAGAYLLGTVTILPARRRAGFPDNNTVAALNDWPIQPLPGEPPLTLLTHKRLAVLLEGREVIRHGDAEGNLVFTPNTEFPQMSLRAEHQTDRPRRYRVARDLAVLAGTTVPWHNQPGGGHAYLLPRSLARHLSDGSLTDITGE